jgi:hypothetical protein
MLFQAIIGASLETLKDFCVGSLHLAIALWVSNRGIADFYVKIFTVPLECVVGELGPVVSDDPVQDPNLQMMDLTMDCLLILTTGVTSDHLVNLSMAGGLGSIRPNLNSLHGDVLFAGGLHAGC